MIAIASAASSAVNTAPEAVSTTSAIFSIGANAKPVSLSPRIVKSTPSWASAPRAFFAARRQLLLSV